MLVQASNVGQRVHSSAWTPLQWGGPEHLLWPWLLLSDCWLRRTLLRGGSLIDKEIFDFADSSIWELKIIAIVVALLIEH